MKSGPQLAAVAAILLLAAPQVSGGVALPSIALAVTFTEESNGTPRDECGTESSFEAPAGRLVEVCYEVTTTGAVDVDSHSLTDSLFSDILVDFE